MKNNTLHISVAVLLVALLFILPTLNTGMPPMAETLCVLAITVLVVLFAGFVMSENGGDERDLLHRMRAGRIAYLSGVGVLTLALVVEGLSHTIDGWILAALGAMVLTKVAARLYADHYQ